MRVLVVVVLLLSGCADPEPRSPVESPPDATASSQWITWNLTAEGRLADRPVAPSSIDLGWGYADWLAGTPPPAWEGDVVAGPFRVLEGRVILQFDVAGAQTGGNARPELTAWWGSSKSIVHHIFIDAPDAVADGQRLRGEAALRVPLGGMVYATGDVPFLSVGSYYLDNPLAATMGLALGGDDPSRLELRVEPVALPGLETPERSQNTFTVAGGRCVADANPNNIAMGTFQLDVEGAQHIRLHLARTFGGPTVDVDMAIANGAGDTISRGQSSLGEEGITLWPPNFEAAGPGPYTVMVYACTAQVVALSVDVEVYA